MYTVKDLIEILQGLPQNAMVMVAGYEYGMDPVRVVSEKWGVDHGNHGATGWAGQFEEILDYDTDPCLTEGMSMVRVVLIGETR